MLIEHAPADTDTHLCEEGSIYAHAYLYDKVMRPSYEALEIDFYDSLAAGSGPVLELACGTGRLALPLARRGHAITGLGISPQMLAVARARAKRADLDIEFLQADMRHFSLPAKFGLVMLGYSSVAHLYTPEDFRRCAASVRRHLFPGGIFAVDAENPTVEQLGTEVNEPHLFAKFLNEAGQEIEVLETATYDWARQTHIRTLTAREPQRRFSTSLETRVHFPQELDALLQLTGFRILQKHGYYSGQPFCSASPRQLLVCSAEDPH